MLGVSIEHIEVQDGIPRTRNRRVKVKMIATKYLDSGESVEDIAAHYGISLADVHAALAYYFDHQETFEEIERRNQVLGEKYGVQSDAHLAELRSRLNENK